MLLIYKAGYLLEGCYFGAIMGSVKIVIIQMPVKDTSYTVLFSYTVYSFSVLARI